MSESGNQRQAQGAAAGADHRGARQFLGWLDGTSNDPKVARKQIIARATDLPNLIRFALGTDLRISEVCGVRICDLDLDGVSVVSGDGMRLVPIVAVRGKVCYIKGKGLVRSDTSKTSSALRSSHCLDSPLTGYAPGSPVKKIRCGRCSPPPAPTGARRLVAVQCASQRSGGMYRGGAGVDDSAHLAAHLRHDPPR